MRYNQFQKMRKRQKESLVNNNSSDDHKGSPGCTDPLEEKEWELKEPRTEMRDPVAKYSPSPSLRDYSSRLYPDEQVSRRWDFEERQARQESSSEDLIAKHFPHGSPRAKSSPSHLVTPKKFNFEEALKRIDDRKELMAKHLSPRSMPIEMPISSSKRGDETSVEILVKLDGTHRNKGYRPRIQTAMRKMKYQYVEDLGDSRSEVLSNVVDKVQTHLAASKPKMGNFLPVATPYCRHDASPRDEDNEEATESNSRFEAPGQIDVIQAPSYETRTDISDVTGLDFQVIRQIYPLYSVTRTNWSPGSVEHHRSELPLRHGGYAEKRRRRIEIDLTGIETVEDAIKSVRNLDSVSGNHVEQRHGLPYESTDFKADDDCSEDSWGRAIVAVERHESRSIASEREPIDVEKLFSEHSLTPPSYVNDMEATRHTDINVRDLIKETFSAEGDLVVDLSEIGEDHVDTLQSPKKSRKQGRIHKITKEAFGQSSEGKDAEEKAAVESPVVQPSPATGNPSETPSSDTVLADLQKNPPSPQQIAALKAQVRSKDSSPMPSPANPFLFSSLETSTKYLKILADGIGSKGKIIADEIGSQGKTIVDGIGSQGKTIVDGIGNQGKMIADGIEARTKLLAEGIGSQLLKLDLHLLPENEMNSMLGVLDKDLKATSSRIPESKAFADFFDQRIHLPSFTDGGLMSCSAPTTMDTDLKMRSMDEMIDNVKQTYEINTTSTVVSTTEEQKSPAHTFIVPISVGGRDIDHFSQQRVTTDSQATANGRGYLFAKMELPAP